MHCYEVIPEGAVCKLYFDLEFHKPSNKGADGKEMVSSLIQVERMFVSSFSLCSFFLPKHTDKFNREVDSVVLLAY